MRDRPAEQGHKRVVAEVENGVAPRDDQVDSLNDEQRRERRDEGRNPEPRSDEAIDEADAGGDPEHRREGEPRVEAVVADELPEDDGAQPKDCSDRKIELTGD